MKPTLPHGPIGSGAAFALTLSVPSVARAFDLDTADSAWLSGAAHPLIESTHCLALLALGFVAGGLPSRSRRLVMAGAAILFFAGIVLGWQGAPPPQGPTVFLSALLCAVLLILARVPPRRAAVGSLGGAFLLAHGIADGGLLAMGEADLSYLAAFIAGNVFIASVGLWLGCWAHRHQHAWAEYLARWRMHS